MAIGFESIVQDVQSLSREEKQRLLHLLAVELRSEIQADDAVLVLQKSLLEAGLLKTIRPRRKDLQAFDSYSPPRVVGKPLSETIIEERR